MDAASVKRQTNARDAHMIWSPTLARSASKEIRPFPSPSLAHRASASARRSVLRPSLAGRYWAVTILAAVICTVYFSRESIAADASSYEKTLTDRGITPDAGSIADYLRQLHPSDKQRAVALELIEKLGSDRFATRQEAMQRLLIMPVLDTEAVVAASNSGDPEVRWRAQRVLAVGRPETERMLYAAFRVIKEKKLSATVPVVIEAIALCDKKHIRIAAQQALTAAATAEDAAHLTAAIESEDDYVRAAVAAALGEALGKDAEEHLRGLAGDDNDAVRLAAARARANYGQRDALNTLVALLESDDVEVRSRAAATLRSLTEKFFSFAAYDTADNRHKALTNWKQWLADDGKTTALKFPLEPWGFGTSFLGGNTLLAFGSRNKVVELDPGGKEIWSYSISGAWSAEKMANGNVLVVSNSSNKVVEVDRQGKVVWEFNTPNPLNAKPLPGGNILIAAFTQKKVLEVTREKKVVWEHSESQYISDAHRLDNGNTLISTMNGPVKEISPEKKVVWEYSGANQAYGCRPLASGNVLIASLSGDVREVNRNKEIVWQISEPNAVDAFRLPNGNTLITGRRFVEFSPDKKVVWEHQGCQYGTARR